MSESSVQGRRTGKKGSSTRKTSKRSAEDDDFKNIPWHLARRVTPEETEMFRKAIENTFGVARPPREPGRPPKPVAAKYKSVSIRLHPKVLDWAKREAKKRGVGYQTFLNEYLLRKSA